MVAVVGSTVMNGPAFSSVYCSKWFTARALTAPILVMIVYAVKLGATGAGIAKGIETKICV
jgi:hypothetical protein